MPDLGLNIRSEVLARSLMVESLTSFFLGALLGIKDLKNSKVLGNKSNPISFNQKIQLLIEINALNPEDNKKFQTFMEVRNQFMHNLEADTFEKCFVFVGNNKADKLLKEYKQDENLTTEEQLRLAFHALSSDVLRLASGLYDTLKEKIRGEVDLKADSEFKKAAMESMNDVENLFNSLFDKVNNAGQTHVSIEELKEFGTNVRRVFYQSISEKLGFAKDGSIKKVIDDFVSKK